MTLHIRSLQLHLKVTDRPVFGYLSIHVCSSRILD